MAIASEFVAVNLNGDWSTVINNFAVKQMKAYSSDRPHLYFMAAFDCSDNFPRQYSANPINTPRVLIEWKLLNDGENHFSYEDMSSLSISTWMLIIQIAFGVMVLKSYLASI